MDDYQNPNQTNMNNQGYQPAPYQPPDNLEPPDQYDEHHGGTGKKIAITLLCLILVAATGAAAYLLKQEKSKVSQLNSQVASANSEVSSLKAEQAKESAKPETPVVKQNQNTVYKAKVGKFTLTLSDQYVVIQKIDGAGEGGSATDVDVGKKTDIEGVVVGNGLRATTVTANPNYAKNYTLQQWIDKVENAGNKEAKRAGTKKIDGVNGYLYTYGGLLPTSKLFFEKNKIYYSIEVTDANNTEVGKQMDLMIKSFKFN